ncbi:MAG: hypothetical protein C0513_00825 [Isosphaera sp.]|nr:hypothetical protein [Isosphaera sp.]
MPIVTNAQPAPTAQPGHAHPTSRAAPPGAILIASPATLPILRAHTDHAGLPVLGVVLARRRVGAPAGEHHSPGPVPLTELPELLQAHPDAVALLCLPSADSPTAAHARALCLAAGVALRQVPTLDALLSTPHPPHSPHPQHTRPTGPATAPDLAQLICRPEPLDIGPIAQALRGRRVLITGAGGSIGSELAHVVAQAEPAEIVLLERSENALFQIDHALGRRFARVPRRAVLHDVVNETQTLRLFHELRPAAVFHAAAHKHVPLMEDHPALAVDNNLFGTKSVADAAIACSAERLVMISSDKAVHPTSVMGATKRLAELYLAWLARRADHPHSTRLSMVRFGNVLGSACSVVPIWQQQLAEGGPITVTDPRMTRYFMTIPEAAALVTRAGTLDQPPGLAPVYVLDMGQPLPILDLAARFLRLHGLTPWIDPAAIPPHLGPHLGPHARLVRTSRPGSPSAEIRLTGARPGEKLFEQLAYAAESLAPTTSPRINRWAGQLDADSPDTLTPAMIEALAQMRSPSCPKHSVLAALQRFVPEMAPQPASPAAATAAIAAA